MTFSESIRTCLREKYVTFSGRASRSEYWWFYLFNIIVNVVMQVLLIVLFGGAAFMATDPGAVGAGAGIGLMIFGLVMMVIGLGLIIPNIAVTVRRLHDRNLSGWWLLGFIAALIVAIMISPTAYLILAIVGGIAMLVTLILKGTDGPNNFGPDPLGSSDADIFN